MRGMWTRRPRVEEDSLRYLVVYIPTVRAGGCASGCVQVFLLSGFNGQRRPGA